MPVGAVKPSQPPAFKAAPDGLLNRRESRALPLLQPSGSPRSVAAPPSGGSRTDNPWSCSHLVSAHPPCSRKGPLLPACGPKCPRRVKRETTNSRFSFRGNLDKIPVDNPVHRTVRDFPTRHRGRGGSLTAPSSGGGNSRASRLRTRGGETGARVPFPLSTNGI